MRGIVENTAMKKNIKNPAMKMNNQIKIISQEENIFQEGIVESWTYIPQWNS
jgi:hypothetical protein